MTRSLAAAVIVLLAGCAHRAPAHLDPVLALIGTHALPASLRAGGMPVGGISGIDYDARHGDWLLATDDRGERGPARFWRARIDYDAGGVHAVAVNGMRAWRQAGGGTYAARGTPGLVADVESLRIDPRDGTLWYGSEGDRDSAMPTFVRHATADGADLGELPLPRRLRTDPACACGARSNVGPEGLSFTPDGAALWVAMEGPLLEDGPVPTTTHGALARLTLATRAGSVLAQYAYPLDPVPLAGEGGGPSDNGISEILALDDRRLLVLERSGRRSAGGWAFDTRLYVVDIGGARTVDANAPLGAAAPALAKRPVAGFAPPPGWQDNYEAMAWGPPLPDGRRTLVVASDNNFTTSPTRVLVFALAR